MASMATRKRQGTTEQYELRKVTKVNTAPLTCPLCDVTLRPHSITTHYEQELQRIQTPPTSSVRRRSSHQGGGATNTRSHSSTEPSITERAQSVLDSVRRKRFRYEHTIPQSSGESGPSALISPSTCPVCSTGQLASSEAAAAQVASCLRDSSDDESFDEYTWCDVTRVRATSLLSPEARANIFEGTVMSNAADTSLDVDVEEDDTDTFGPPQFSEKDVQECGQSGHVSEQESDYDRNSSVQCLVCMSPYTSPLVSVLCWHVFCESCWLQALKTKKLCPKCKRITCAGDLRRIFL